MTIARRKQLRLEITPPLPQSKPIAAFMLCMKNTWSSSNNPHYPASLL